MKNRGQMNILIGDDDRDFCNCLDESLNLAGFATSSAYEGVRVLEIAHKQHPDLILLDIQMPAGTGRKVLQALRESNETKKIPVIVMTGLEDSGLEFHVMDEGANGFIKKPFEINKLLRKIQALLVHEKTTIPRSPPLWL